MIMNMGLNDLCILSIICIGSLRLQLEEQNVYIHLKLLCFVEKSNDMGTVK